MRVAVFVFGLISLAAPLFVAPLVNAHGPTMSFDEATSAPGMMQYLEDRVLGGEVHEEMEDLMGKMMRGTLSESEADRLAVLMQDYPGPMVMMINRLSRNGAGVGQRDTMGWGSSWNRWGGGFWIFLVTLAVIVWTLVGIFALVWLWKAISK